MSEPATKTAQTALVASRDEAKQSESRQSDSRLPWIGASVASRELLELARKVADTSTTLLITGESGTGKDRLARWIHEESRGAKRRS